MTGAQSARIFIELNGEPRSVGSATVAALLRELEVPVDRVAVEVDRRLVRRVDWETTPIVPGSRVEIVHFVGGG